MSAKKSYSYEFYRTIEIDTPFALPRTFNFKKEYNIPN